jgi:hypothetical protein
MTHQRSYHVRYTNNRLTQLRCIGLQISISLETKRNTESKYKFNLVHFQLVGNKLTSTHHAIKIKFVLHFFEVCLKILKHT